MIAYFDNSATTKPCPEAVQAVAEAMTEDWGNPSSLHNLGIAAHRRVELARGQVARALGRPLINTDVKIEERAGISCGEYIRRYGEAAFRDLETETVGEAAANTGCVIATGGGVVTRPRNMEMLRQHGVVFHILRPLEELEITPERPLSDTPQKLRALWETRGPLYAACRDYAVEGRDAGERAQNVVALFRKHFQ